MRRRARARCRQTTTVACEFASWASPIDRLRARCALAGGDRLVWRLVDALEEERMKPSRPLEPFRRHGFVDVAGRVIERARLNHLRHRHAERAIAAQIAGHAGAGRLIRRDAEAARGVLPQIDEK